MPVATGATAHESGSPIGVGEDEVGVVGVDRADPCPVGTGFPRYDEVGLAGLFSEEFSMSVATATTAHENGSPIGVGEDEVGLVTFAKVI